MQALPGARSQMSSRRTTSPRLALSDARQTGSSQPLLRLLLPPAHALSDAFQMRSRQTQPPGLAMSDVPDALKLRSCRGDCGLYSPPCQAPAVAGAGQGLNQGPCWCRPSGIASVVPAVRASAGLAPVCALALAVLPLAAAGPVSASYSAAQARARTEARAAPACSQRTAVQPGPGQVAAQRGRPGAAVRTPFFHRN